MDQGIIIKELQFKAVRSSGPGGQHANKVSSKIELSFDVDASLGLSPEEKQRICLKLRSRLTAEKILKLNCEESRSQHKNKELVTKRFFLLLKKALEVPKKRKPTKPSKSSVEQRLKSKRKQSNKKINRKRPDLD
ncbi:alternative ribosome rescue aminoacyl-tRNA hydrolase ArfB [Flagellimonas meridianipacifica]|uniref:Ribosome-associated protein n=1 Tax=Flagellimonas meridianipacifica TaxID=1080225 RepID=A0A2T0MGY6_9FLAO|nr:alternative ribosome rescue aminoacyl-tRNA hydrolase ArfB [Allomuricauda pacifica]PRX56822.1 ribosome-associated protein [Allomuricauda pacifica]